MGAITFWVLDEDACSESCIVYSLGVRASYRFFDDEAACCESQDLLRLSSVAMLRGGGLGWIVFLSLFFFFFLGSI